MGQVIERQGLIIVTRIFCSLVQLRAGVRQDGGAQRRL